MAEGAPRYELLHAPSSREQAAAIIAAVERFMRATAAPASPPSETVDGWQRAAILEGVSREPEGDIHNPWINT